METMGEGVVDERSDFILYSPNSWSFPLATREHLFTGPEKRLLSCGVTEM